MANPMAVTLDTFNSVTGSFSQHYFINCCSGSYSGKDFSVPWDQFAAAVNSFIANNNVPASSVALVFVYCYDNTSCCFYLQMQICTMQASGIQGTYILQSNPAAWYELNNGSITPITPLPAPVNQAYLNNFYYCDALNCDPSTSQQLASNPGLYVQSIAFPWSIEVLQMYLDNSSPQGATLNFAGCCYNQGSGAQLQYPQGLVLYLRDSTGNALMDNNTYPADFTMKGCDMGTSCPPRCGVYVQPMSLGK